MQQEQAQDGSLLGAAERHRAPVDANLQRPEKEELDQLGVGHGTEA